MAGITDQPFRQLCCQMGAGLAVSEMISSNPKVWHTEKSKLRSIHSEFAGIRSVQIAGSDPEELAFAAKVNVENGAQIIDINMGCPAKKVNKKLAGSALLKEPKLVEEIVRSVVDAVNICHLFYYAIYSSIVKFFFFSPILFNLTFSTLLLFPNICSTTLFAFS